MKSRGHVARIDHDGDDRLFADHPSGMREAMNFTPSDIIATRPFR